jgi:hypothetical protein
MSDIAERYGFGHRLSNHDNVPHLTLVGLTATA